MACSQYDIFSDVDGEKILSGNPLNSFDSQDKENLFLSTNDKIALETPDLKVIEDNAISSISVPSIVSVKVLGDTFGTSFNERREIVDYIVQPGDTVESVAQANSISLNTLLWANELTQSSRLKEGQNLIILPIDGILYPVKSGDILGDIANKYKSKVEDIIAFNNLSGENDIYIGDILVVPGGTVQTPKQSPKGSTPSPLKINIQVPLANNYFIFPTQGRISQGLHYFNGIDVANRCGTPVYSAAGGTIQRAVSNGGWNLGMGNHVTILHSNGTVTYYGHLQSVFVRPGERVEVGQNIGVIGRTGRATGCHLHFQVMGATNPLAKYAVGSQISFK